MKKTITKLVALAAFSFALFSGCQTKLDPAGVYAGDTFLYNSDATIRLVKTGLNEFVKWEFEHRQQITNTWPQVTIAADKIRSEAPGMFGLVGIARTSYVQIKSGLGTSTNETAALASARAAFQDSVEALGQKANEVNNVTEPVTLSSKPKKILLPAQQ